MSLPFSASPHLKRVTSLAHIDIQQPRWTLRGLASFKPPCRRPMSAFRRGNCAGWLARQAGRPADRQADCWRSPSNLGFLRLSSPSYYPSIYVPDFKGWNSQTRRTFSMNLDSDRLAGRLAQSPCCWLAGLLAHWLSEGSLAVLAHALLCSFICLLSLAIVCSSAGQLACGPAALLAKLPAP